MAHFPSAVILQYRFQRIFYAILSSRLILNVRKMAHETTNGGLPTDNSRSNMKFAGHSTERRRQRSDREANDGLSMTETMEMTNQWTIDTTTSSTDGSCFTSVLRLYILTFIHSGYFDSHRGRTYIQILKIALVPTPLYILRPS